MTNPHVAALLDEADVRRLLRRAPGEPTNAPPPDCQYKGTDLWLAVRFLDFQEINP